MKAIAPILVAALLMAASAAAYAGDFQYDFFGPYLQRKDSITPGAGNSQAVNTVTHMIDPWPPYAGNRRIPGNGERMTGAVERSRDVSKLPAGPMPLSHPADGATSTSSTTSSATGK